MKFGFARLGSVKFGFARVGISLLLGIMLNEKAAVHRWAMSLHICSRLMKDVADLKDSVIRFLVRTISYYLLLPPD